MESSHRTPVISVKDLQISSFEITLGPRYTASGEGAGGMEQLVVWELEAMEAAGVAMVSFISVHKIVGIFDGHMSAQ